jgi:cysteinyl-tRNA synthetase
MSIKYLGKHFDIHTGGEDHIPIHHTNEIAQSEASTGQKFVNYWMHGAFLTSKGEKVSKSKGGLYTIEELEKEKFHPSSYRYLCLTTHYRKPLAFSLESLKSAQNAFESLKNKIPELKSNQTSKGSTKDYIKRFLEAINDDLNIPKALSLIWIVLKDNSLGNKEKYKLIIDFNEILGLDLKKKKEKTSKDISDLIKKRNTARKNKDFKLADKIRNDLSKKGIILEDTKDGTIWKKK